MAPAPVRSLADLDLTRTYIYADYLTWQLSEWVELLRGKVAQTSGPLDIHQFVVGKLHGNLFAHLRRQVCQVRIAPYDVRLTRPGGNTADDAITTVVQPDVCVICDPNRIDRRGCNGAPDWIIEVLSPGTLTRDMRDKFDLYEEAGVGEYWIVAPGEQTIAACVRNAGTERYELIAEYTEPGALACRTLPGLALNWDDIFA